jgi:hypothetical protein
MNSASLRFIEAIEIIFNPYQTTYRVERFEPYCIGSNS